MKVFEEAHQETEENGKEGGLTNQEKIRIINQMQMQLARDFFAETAKNENEIMLAWIDRSRGQSLSEKFRSVLIEHPEFLSEFRDTNPQHPHNQA